MSPTNRPMAAAWDGDAGRTDCRVGQQRTWRAFGQVPVILMTPQGRVFSQAVARELAAYPRLAFICGRYEGIDERVCQLVVTDEISIGDYVLTGGELPAMVMIDAIARNIPACSVRGGPPTTIRTRRDCWNTRSIPVRRSIEDLTYRPRCSAVTTPGSTNGGVWTRSGERGRAVRSAAGRRR